MKSGFGCILSEWRAVRRLSQLELAVATGISQRHISFVESGLGIAAVPRMSMPRKGHPSLVSVPIVEPEVTRTVGLIKRRGRSLSPSAEHLYGMLRAVAQKQAAAANGSTPPQCAEPTAKPSAPRKERTRNRRTAGAP